MARTEQKTVTYFPHKCNHGREMNIIEQRYGNDGYCVTFKLFEQLGKHESHYIDVSNDLTMMYMVSVFNVSETKATNILSDLAKLGIIDQHLYEKHSVIFSKEFTEGIRDAYRKRTGTLMEYSDLLKIFEPNIEQTDVNLAEEIDKTKQSKTDKTKTNDLLIRQTRFGETLVPHLEKYGAVMIREFFNYWTEPMRNGKKFRAEQQSTWEVSRRLVTWKKNKEKYDGVKNNNGTKSNHGYQPAVINTDDFVQQLTEDITNRGIAGSY